MKCVDSELSEKVTEDELDDAPSPRSSIGAKCHLWPVARFSRTFFASLARVKLTIHET
jgi:hypothetical protein